MEGLTSEEIAYAAGFVDGEGAICIIPYHKTERAKNITYYKLEVTVTNAYFPVMIWFKEKFGGYTHVFSNGVKKNGEPCALIMNWRLRSKEAVAFLKVVLPYLKQKRSEAEVAIAFYSYKGNGNLGKEKNDFLKSKQEELCRTLKSVRKDNILGGQKVCQIH